jgi:hypothetical protein
MQAAQGGVVPKRDSAFLAFNLGRCAALYIAPSGAPVNFLSVGHRDAHARQREYLLYELSVIAS